MRSLRGFGVLFVSLVAGLVASNAAAQLVPLDGVWVTSEEAAAAAAIRRAPSVPSSPAPSWGLASTSTLSIGACDAALRDSTNTYSALDCLSVTPIAVGTDADVGFPVHLPAGALITSVTMYFFDNDPVDDISAGLHRINSTGTRSPLQSLFTGGSVTGGNNTFTGTLATPHQVDNTAGTYVILAILHRTASTFQGIYGFEVKYRLQVSPAPASATFLDVPVGSGLHRFVEALVASGLTAGCGGGNYCPGDPVTRGQMAVFLAGALGLHFPN